MPDRYAGGAELSIKDNISLIREKIEKARAVSGVERKVLLCAATKTRTVGEIREALEGGVDIIGENRVQEARDKYGEFKGAPRHFIGSLQKNKVKYCFDLFDCIQSVDSLDLLKYLDLQAVRRNSDMDYMIEVNISAEDSKHGFEPGQLEEVMEKASQCERIRLTGTMAMLPLSHDLKLVGRKAAEMYRIYEGLRKLNNGKNIAVEHLSMGMSGDYEIAIAEGSNLVRIGTSIFGERSSRCTL